LLGQAPTASQLAAGVSQLKAGGSELTVAASVLTSGDVGPGPSDFELADHQPRRSSPPGGAGSVHGPRFRVGHGCHALVNLRAIDAEFAAGLHHADLQRLPEHSRRSPTLIEMQSWLAKLTSNQITPDQLTQQLLASSEFSQIAYATEA